MRIFIVGLVALSLLNRCDAQDWAKKRLDDSPRHGEWVAFKHGDRQVDAFITYPEVATPATGVVVIHEIFGLTDWVRGVTDQLAEAGYIAIAPDLLSGMGPGGGNTSSFEGTDGARRGIAGLPPEQITADLNAAVEYLRQLPACNGKVVVIGFCWGGGQTFRFATNNDSIQAACPFYGSGPQSAEEIQRIDCPVYGFFAENDARVNASLPPTEELMKQAGKSWDLVVYEGAGHGFMRAGEAPDANPANRQAREQAWQRLKEILSSIN